MDKAIETLVAGLVNLLIVAGGLWLNGIRQKQAREKQSADLQRDMMATLREELQALRSQVEKNQAELEKSQKHNKDLSDNLQEQLTAQSNERKYYRETISELRNDNRNMVQLVIGAQKETEALRQEKNGLTDANQNLQATHVRLREQIVQLTTQLQHVTEERQRLQTQLEQLQAASQENAVLRLEIESLKREIADKTKEIERLTNELNALRQTNINPAMVLTAPDTAIGANNPQ